ncbi:MAG: lysine--tRNA ligase [Planctomycetota bacterium]
MTPTPPDTNANPPEISPSETLAKLEAQRRANRDAVTELGLDPYGGRTDDLLSLADAHARYDEAADTEHQEKGKGDGFVDRRPIVKVAGRVMLHRDGGKLIWMNLRDATGDLQIAVSKKDCHEIGFNVAKKADLSDLVVAEGPLMRTRKGEVTIWASSLRPASKSLVPPPEKHAGLQDVETRYRQRYVDLWANPETMRVFQLRSAVVAAIRAHLHGVGFTEVETPMLQSQAGGAAARPFITHLNALDIDLSLRIAPELYLKRLLVGGMSKVFEINRNFRNEGVDRSHNPEFTMLELYDAHGNVETVMSITEGVVRAAARAASCGEDLTLPFGELSIDYAQPFGRVTYAELFERALGFAPSDTDKLMAAAAEHKVKTKNDKGEALDPVFIANELFEDVAEPSLDPARPTWIMEYPAALSPLTRPKRDNPSVAERADLFIAGMEIGPHYTELNDPDVQEQKFREQLAGADDEEQTFRTFDDDFVHALKVGMPPAGGMGLGIDRLVMLLANQPSIRDVLLFPFMRPLER